jgi:tetratricopeptide (TPR) repeat protein
MMSVSVFRQKVVRMAYWAAIQCSLAVLCLTIGCARSPFTGGNSNNAHIDWVCNDRADRAIQRGDTEIGITLHEAIVAKYPNNGLALYHLGYAYGRAGSHLKEAAYYEKAIALGFESDSVFFNLGMAYLDLDQPDKSIKAFHRALIMDQESADSHFGLAIAYQRKGEEKKAEREFLKAIEIDPEHLEARLNLSWLYADTGDFEKARKGLREILKTEPDHTIARESLECVRRR